jgi:DNA-binding transcriptional LysR family regulator
MTMNLDPAQLVALNVLLEEGHVTRAARRLGITQSSMSHRLAQLRSALGDPLFVRVGASLRPTPRAQAIAGPLAEALRALAASVAPAERFDPSASRLVVGIAMPDLLATLAPRLAAALTNEAPHIEVRMTPIAPALSTTLAGDPPGMALAPARFLEGDIRSRSLGELRFGVVGRKDHPALRRALTTERWLAHGHVTVRTGNERTNLIEEALARLGLARRVALEVPSFLAGLLVVARSDFLMNAPMPLVNEAAAQLGLRLRDAPIPLPTVRFVLAWHSRFEEDAAHRWARERVFTAVRPAFDLPTGTRSARSEPGL